MRQAEQEIYEELADKYDRQGDARQRDLFLVLAADAAFSAGSPDQADRLRLRLLELSPHHLLRPFASFAERFARADIQDYLVNLRRQFSAGRNCWRAWAARFHRPRRVSLPSFTSRRFLACKSHRLVPGLAPPRARCKRRTRKAWLRFPIKDGEKKPSAGRSTYGWRFLWWSWPALPALAGWTILRPLW